MTSDDGEVKSTVKARGRRTTKVKQEAECALYTRCSRSSANTNLSDEEDAAESASQAVVPKSTAVTARTPGRPRRRSELPPSPADVADDIEYAATRMYASVNDLYTVSGISERLDQLRDLCSSVTGVQMTFLILEGLALQQQLLPWKTAMMIPSFHLLGMEIPDILLPLPDLFALVTSDFWYPATLWATTSIFIPLLFAYFFNLTTRDVKRHGAHVTVMRYRADPLTFNVVKALMTWIVYQSQYTLFGLFDPDVALSINHAMFGGHRQMLVGSCIGMLAALYEAAQRK